MSADRKDRNEKAPPSSESQPTSTGSSAPTVDIDALTVKILMIVSAPSAFQTVSTFLTRRGWPTNVASSMNEAIRFLTNDKPDFVLLSVNHPSPKMAMLPNLLAQTFNSQCVAFAEKTDHKTVGKLNAMRVAHKMMGPVSGPSIQRKLKMILAEMHGLNQGQSTAAQKAEGAEDDGGDITISQRRSSADGPDVLRFANNSAQNGFVQVKGHSGSRKPEDPNRDGSSENDEDALIRLQRALMEDPEADLKLLGELQGEPANPAKDAPASFDALDADTAPEWSPDESEELRALAASLDEKAEAADHESDRREKGSVIASDGAQTKKPNTSPPEGSVGREGINLMSGTPDTDSRLASGEANSGDSTELTSGSKEASEAANGSRMTTGPKATTSASAGADTDPSTTFSESESERAERDRIAEDSSSESTRSTGLEATGDSSGSEDIEREKNVLPPEQDYIFEAIKVALDSSCDPAAQKIQHLTQVQWLGVVPVSAQGFNGYLLLSTSLGTDTLHRLCKSFRLRLMEQLRSAPQNFEISAELSVYVTPVLFQPWARQFLPLLYARESGPGEAAVTFLPVSGSLLPQYQNAADPEKLEVNLADLDESAALTFSAFLRLEENKKYFMLVKDGSRLSHKQQRRLMDRRVPLFIDKKDLAKYITYFVTYRLQRARDQASAALGAAAKKAG